MWSLRSVFIIMEPIWVTDSMYRVLTNISFYFIENITIFKVTLEVLGEFLGIYGMCICKAMIL